MKTFSQWLSSDAGQASLAIEKACLAKYFYLLYSQHLLLLGEPGQAVLLDDFKAKHTAIISEQLLKTMPENAMLADFAELPLAENSVDTIVLPHTLESSAQPEQLLRQLALLSQAHSYVIIIGFQPMAWRRLWQSRQLPKLARYYSLTDLDKLLTACGFVIAEKHYLFTSPSWLDKMPMFLRHAFSMFAHSYVILAKKKRIDCSAQKPDWRSLTDRADNRLNATV